MAAEDDDWNEDDEEETPLEAVAAGAVTFLTLAVAFGLMALGNPYFWVAFVVGFGGGMPLAVGLAKYYESRHERERGRSPRTGDSDTDAALADLRERYARGELDDEAFEARVERLLETESITDAREYVERTGEKDTDAGPIGDTPETGDEERERVTD
jgi:uncharacterized membrane protein